MHESVWSPKESSRRVHFVQRVAGWGERGSPKARRMARGKAAGGRGARCSREWFGSGRRIHEREEVMVVSRSWSRAGAEASREL